MEKGFFEKNSDAFYFIFRVAVGLLFMQHGMQKLFGLLGGQKQELFTLMGAVGVIEFFGGILIAVGLFTRLAAFLGGCVMIGAWFKVHVLNGWVPILNKGELALLYLVCFLIILSRGAGIYGLDNSKKKV